VRGNSLETVDRKKQCNTGVQALAFSGDGKVMFSSAGQKEVAISPFRIGEEDIVSVEFGGFSSAGRTDDQTVDDFGGDLRIMGIDVRDIIAGVYLVLLVLSDSTVKVLPLETMLMSVVHVQSRDKTVQSCGVRKIYDLLSLSMQICSGTRSCSCLCYRWTCRFLSASASFR
jgi:hypothetical protein